MNTPRLGARVIVRILAAIVLAGLIPAIGSKRQRLDTQSPSSSTSLSRTATTINQSHRSRAANVPTAGSKSDRDDERYDQPAEAVEYYRLKRLPQGETEIPVERYFAAQERMQLMPQFSSVEGRFLPSRRELKNREAALPALPAWTSLGPGNIGGRTRALVIHPTDPNTIYAAGVAGGVWKTVTGGTSWTPMADLIANLAVSALALDPTNPNILYAGTGEGFFNDDSVRGAGIFRTTDGGATWTQISSTATPDFHYVNDLVVSSKNNQRLYAATRTGVWRSTNGGTNWSRVLDPALGGGCLDLAVRTDLGGDYLFAACGTSAGASSSVQARVYRHPNAEGAAPWSLVLSEAGMGRTSLAVAPSNQNVVYAAAADNTPGFDQHRLHAVFRSTASGDPGSWTAQVRKTDANKLNTALFTNPFDAFRVECGRGVSNFPAHQGFYDNVIAVDPADANRVWVGGIDLFRSDDGGQNWGLASYWWANGRLAPLAPSYAHADQHAIVFHPQYNGTTNKIMFVGNDGGIFRTGDARAGVATASNAACNPANSAVTWASLNNNYGVTQFYHGVPYPDGKTWFGGTQDNGTLRGNDAGGANQWQEINGGDGGYVAVDPTNPNILYAATSGISMVKSTDGGATFNPATSGISDSGLFISPFVMDPSNPKRLWTGGIYLWRTTNGAQSWQRASAITAGTGLVSAIGIAPADSNFVVVGMSSGEILYTTSGLTTNSTTSFEFTRPRSGFVSWIAFDPANKNNVYATYSTFGGFHVWKSANGGASWSPLDGAGAMNLPDVPVHCLIVDPNNPLRLYVGTDLGVFASTDGGANWAVENTGFANVVTESLSLNNTGGVTTLFAFTHGRGAWRVTAGQGECNFAISPVEQSFDAAGGAGSISVTATGANCSRTAASNAPWITINSGASGQGSGAVNFTVAANSSQLPRTGTISVAGRTFTVAQSSCASISPSNAFFEAAGGSGTGNIAAAGGCSWTAASPVSWITLSTASGTGSATVNFTVAANPDPAARTTTLTIAGQPLLVSQAGAGGSCATAPISVGQAVNGSLAATDCSSLRRGDFNRADRYSFSGAAGQQVAIWTRSSDFDTYVYLFDPAGAVIAENDDGGERTNARIPSGAGFFTLPASGAYLIEVTSFGSGATGNYTLSLSGGSPGCSYSISPNNQSFTSAGGTGSINVTTGSGCNWQAASNATWVTITSGGAGSGPGAVNFTVAANSGVTRGATIFVAGQSFTVTQAGAVTLAGGMWSGQSSGTPNNLFSVHFSDNTRGWIAGANGTLRVTNDAGTSWDSVSLGQGPLHNLNSVRTLGASVVWVGGERVTALSQNGGASWSRLEFDPATTRRRLFPIDSFNAIAVGEVSGLTAHFFDSILPGFFGSSLVYPTFIETLNDLYLTGLTDADNGWTVGDQGRIIRLTKARSSESVVFAAQPGHTQQQLNGVFALNLDFAWAVGNGGVILRTTDGGQTWTAQTSGTTANLRDVHFTDADHGWVVGEGGVILATSNGGQTWTGEISSVTTPLNGINFTANGLGIIVGDAGVILKRSLCTYAIAPTSAQIGFSGGTGQVNVTTAAGCAWTATGNVAWLTVTAGTSSSGSGNGTVSYTVAPNPATAPRTGTMTIAGQTFTVTQAGTPIACPTLSGINPTSGTAGSTVTISGTNFTGVTAVKFANNVLAQFTVGSDTQLTATVPAGAVTGPLTISKAGCADLQTPPFTVNHPIPAISNLSPGSAIAGGASFVLTVNGSNFVNSSGGGSIVRWNGEARSTSFASSTQLTAIINSADIANAGAASVTVFNPAPGGGASNAVSFNIIQPNPVPSIDSLSPDSAFSGGAAFTLTVNGSGFVSGAVVRWNNNDRATTFVSSARLTAAIPASDLAVAGLASITVFNPAPGGGVSLPEDFTIAETYEADVAPRPNGNGLATTTDWVQLGRFAAGLDQAEAGSEFRRADCAPRSTLGDGRLTVSDWVQAGRYAAGLDPLTPAGGPTTPAGSTSLTNGWSPTDANGRPMNIQLHRINASDLDPSGRWRRVAISIDARGDENALGFSLLFNPSEWRFVSAVAGRDAPGATLHVNASEFARGRIGLALALPVGQTIEAGPREMAVLQFTAVSGAQSPFAIAFADQPVAREVADAHARALPSDFAFASPLRTVANVSAASFTGSELAPGQIAAAFGERLSVSAASALSLPLPLEIGGTRVVVTDSEGVARAAPLLFVSPRQINYLIPTESSRGTATVAITNADGEVSIGLAHIAETALGLFAANGDGRGAAAAVVLRVRPDGAQRIEPAAAFDPAQNRFVAAPLDLPAADEQVFLICFGTGLGGHDSPPGFTAAIAGQPIEVAYAGRQGGFAGLDQVNLRLPRSLAGRGEVDVVLTVNGKTANTVRISVK